MNFSSGVNVDDLEIADLQTAAKSLLSVYQAVEPQRKPDRTFDGIHVHRLAATRLALKEACQSLWSDRGYELPDGTDRGEFPGVLRELFVLAEKSHFVGDDTAMLGWCVGRLRQWHRGCLDVGPEAEGTNPANAAGWKERRARLNETIEDQMWKIFRTDRRCIRWSAKDWSAELDCSQSAIKRPGNKAWQAVMSDRHAERERKLTNTTALHNPKIIDVKGFTSPTT